MIDLLRRLACLCLLAGCAAAASFPVSAAGDVLVFGRISDDPAAHHDQLKPLLDYVVPRMAGVGIREGRVLMARDPQQMASYLRRGQVDWVTETAASATVLEARAGARPLLLTERDGTSHYHSLYFARRDSGIRTLDGLRGRVVAFQQPGSTSAYFVPAAELLARGQRLEILLSPQDPPVPGAVGYLFARSELNIATWVHKRVVDAGVISNLDWDNPRTMPPAFRHDLVVLARSPEYPRALELVRGDLPPRVRERLREVLLAAADDPAAGPALRRFFGTTRFLPVDPGTRAALGRLRAGVERVRADAE